MAVIAFARSEKGTWLAARWAHNRFLNDIIARRPDDAVVAQIMHRAIALDGLHLDLLYEEDKALADKIKTLMRDVAVDIVEGKDRPSLCWRHGLSEADQRMYVQSIKDLLQIIDIDSKSAAGNAGDADRAS